MCGKPIHDQFIQTQENRSEQWKKQSEEEETPSQTETPSMETEATGRDLSGTDFITLMSKRLNSNI